MQWLSPLILRFLHSIALKSLIQAGKAIASSFVVLLISFVYNVFMEKNISCGGPFWPYSQGSGEGGT